MMPLEGYGQENALIKHDNPAAALSAIGPKKKITRLETVFSPVLPRQHGQLSSAVTTNVDRLAAVLTKTIHFSQFPTPFPAARLQPCPPDYSRFSPAPTEIGHLLLDLPTIFCPVPPHPPRSRMGCAGVGATELLNRLSYR